ncbi:MAG: aspartate-semialdehyde dehydrogenase [Deltaproteobacteria bacterium]|nr:aspartate-semialdehyde dehydrogenase [Deltaproteobacteria bacterium]
MSTLQKKPAYVVAVVGATGAVGSEMIHLLEERKFPVERLVPLASDRSMGRQVTFGGAELDVVALHPKALASVDIALFSAGGSVSAEYAPMAAAAGTLVIDNSSTFRMEPDVPLVVPEVNSATAAGWRRRGMIANPNCSTIQLTVVLKPLHEAAGLTRVVVATYQATSGAGGRAMDEMLAQIRAVFAGEEPENHIFPHPIAFNCLPQIDRFLDNGYTKEEWKVIEESKKILGLPDLCVTATAVRVPVFIGHSEAVNVSLERPLSADEARAFLRVAPGVIVEDDPATQTYPQARRVAGSDAVYVGRIRQDVSQPRGLDFWVVADNLRKGAALNAVQIAEIVTARYL